MSEFDLSKRRKRLKECIENSPVEFDYERILQEVEHQDKEFILRLKEKILYRHQGGHSSVSDVCNEEIDKLIGEDLR
jgi:hypothetical protein